MNLLRKLLKVRPQRHEDPTPDGMFRLMRLHDELYADFNGTRAWCRAELNDCKVCGGRCCDCKHHELRGGRFA